MIRNRNRHKALNIEPLEGKQLLSTLHSALAHPDKAHVAPPAHAISIAGTIQSPTSSIRTFTTNGHNYGSFYFSGRVKSLGAINGAFVTALDTTGQFMSTGLMRLVGKRGTVDLNVQQAPGDKSSYVFTISMGTGAFASATGSGRIQSAGLTTNNTVLNFAITMNPR